MRAALLALPLTLLLLAAAGARDRAPDPQQVDRGRQVFELVCSGCHTIQPPPDSAPPMSHVARHLRQELTTLDAFTEHVRSYVPAPSAERSRLPAMAIERFGLMGALPMEDAVLNDVAAYIWTLADSARGGMGEGMEHGVGMEGGMGMEHGMGMKHGQAGGPGGMGMRSGASGEGMACMAEEGRAGTGMHHMRHRNGVAADSLGAPCAGRDECPCRRGGSGGGR